MLLTVEKILYTFTTQVSLKKSQPCGYCDRFSHFCTAHGTESYTSQWAARPPLKTAPSHGGSEPPSDTWFPGPTPSHFSQQVESVVATCNQRLYLLAQLKKQGLSISAHDTVFHRS